ncbi:zinc-ribbon domain-containing protein [Pontibacter oryzae]|uniref:Zinc-ribbon domain-containing protein n=1 Tax=Pontibacter oryzae TaxID=2304593 RepID=A0A399S5K3_9BACT|nr:zinc-ribbon domain-containing protein [Pontibacter oryzae]RIJ37663.1 zinc-ribbon domain-containing protein [Pontibacter oryzae]
MATPQNTPPKNCPACGASVPANATQCPECGAALPPKSKNWFRNLTPTEIFLMVIGLIMLSIGLVAV